MKAAGKRPAKAKPSARRKTARKGAHVAQEYIVPSGKVLVLRTCLADMRSPSGDARGFVWPRSGPVEAKDWNPAPVCGHGLHGALWGEGGGGSPWVWDDSGVWLVVEVDEAAIVKLDGKVKFPRGVVVFAGPRMEATTFLAKRAPGRAIVGGTATAGHGGTATAGDGGTATAGHRGTATAGDGGTATAGDRGVATAGDGGTATAGDRGVATAGDRGVATAGDGGTATAGVWGTATAGDRGVATAGDGGELRIREWDSKADRYRTRVAWVGEGGIEKGVAYELVNGQFVPRAKR